MDYDQAKRISEKYMERTSLTVLTVARGIVQTHTKEVAVAVLDELIKSTKQRIEELEKEQS